MNSNKICQQVSKNKDLIVKALKTGDKTRKIKKIGDGKN